MIYLNLIVGKGYLLVAYLPTDMKAHTSAYQTLSKLYNTFPKMLNSSFNLGIKIRVMVNVSVAIHH